MTSEAFGAALASAGLDEHVVAGKRKLFGQARDALRAWNARAEVVGAVHVPGRIELLGKHTDYAGGRSLLCATERGIVAVSSPRDDGRLLVVEASEGASVELALAPDAVGGGPSWATYAEAVARRVSRNFPSSARGATIAFAGDLPQAAGLSSSSALVVALFLALAHVSRIEACAEYTDAIRTPEDLAGYLATVENGSSFGRLAGDRGVGTFGGSEDHTAMLCCRRGLVSQYAFGPVRWEADLALPDDLTLIVAASGVAARKTGAAREAYNSAARAAGQVLDRWNEAAGRRDASLGAACDVGSDAPSRIREAIGQPDGRAPGEHDLPASVLRDRFDQFCEESLVIVPEASAALSAGDLATFGTLVSRSQRLAERLLRNQVPETEHLARAALRLGALASSAFGAGFGGSVWALVPRERASPLLETWRRDYVERFPARVADCAFFETRPAPAVVRP